MHEIHDGGVGGPTEALPPAPHVPELIAATGARGSDLGRLASVDLNLLVPLLALLEERSVTVAARRIGMSPSALSHALGRIRRLLGDEVLVRQGTTMAPTPRALHLIDPLRAALTQVGQVVRPSAADPLEGRRSVTLAMTNSVALVLAGPLVGLLAQRAPGVELRLRTMAVSGQVDEVFAQHGADVLLLPRAFETAYEREPLAEDRWVALTRVDAPDLPVEELLSTLPHIVFDAPGYRVRPYEELETRGIEVRVLARVGENILIPSLVANTGAIAFQRRIAALQFTSQLGVRVHELPFRVREPGIDLVWNPWTSGPQWREWMRSLLHDVIDLVESNAKRQAQESVTPRP